MVLQIRCKITAFSVEEGQWENEVLYELELLAEEVYAAFV